ncbi:hypothetical protein BDP27DRAFT_1430479 [Rhodocollybia butyracea]|uniref:Helicase ATP-binding domain-containing protein n=1 Tax=Rhodocollybia butyracea TaxID=206335 RepID=A0A9P5PBF6_9AGAR|nr:hypothetical protein BDP27DRAFT_1430479 [Rhodocollybia butyracea]
MPGTLRSQWLQELKTLFLPKSIDIFQYDCPKSGNPGFWDPTGPFHSSKHQLQNRIILVTHSSLQNDFSRVYQSSRGASSWTKKPSELPQRTRELKETLYHQEYLTVSLDEAHEMRNLGPKYYSALTALKQGRIKLALTATPLLTSPKHGSSSRNTSFSFR